MLPDRSNVYASAAGAVHRYTASTPPPPAQLIVRSSTPPAVLPDATASPTASPRSPSMHASGPGPPVLSIIPLELDSSTIEVMPVLSSALPLDDSASVVASLGSVGSVLSAVVGPAVSGSTVGSLGSVGSPL